MAYIDLTRITDRHAKDIIERDSDITQDALYAAEKDTKSQARFCGVQSTDIPLADGSGDLAAGNIISEPLYNFCEYRFLYRLFSGARGIVGLEDVYTDKAESYKADSQEIKENITYSTIVTEDNEVIDSDSRTRSVPIGC